MPPRILTCLTADINDLPQGMLRVPPVFPLKADIPVRVMDEAGTMVGVAIARADMYQADGAFRTSREVASNLGLEEGFDYFIEPLEPPPPQLKLAVLRHKGDKVLAECCSKAMAFLKLALVDGGARIVQPGNPAFRFDDSVLEYTADVHPAEMGPPWLLSTQTQVILEDTGGPGDVIIAVDGPASMNKADLGEGSGNTPSSRREILCEGVSRFCQEMAFNSSPGRVALFLLTEEASPLLFSEGGATTPWLHCSAQGQQDVVNSDSIKNILITRLEGDLPPGRNLAASLKGLIEFIHQHNAETPDLTVTVILISDGQYTEGPNPVSVLKEESQHGMCYVLHVIGLGEEVEEPILRRCAQLGHGSYDRIDRADRFLDKMTDFSRRFQVVAKEGGSA